MSISFMATIRCEGGYYECIEDLIKRFPDVGFYATRCFSIDSKSVLLWVSPRVGDLEVPSKDARKVLLQIPDPMRRRNRPPDCLREARLLQNGPCARSRPRNVGQDRVVGGGELSPAKSKPITEYSRTTTPAGWPRPARTSGIFVACTACSRRDIRISRWRLRDKRRPKGLSINISNSALLAI